MTGEGIDYTHPDFRNQDGTTRILYLWDQTGVSAQNREVEEEVEESFLGVGAGTVYTREEINEALSEPNRALQLQKLNATDLSGHGTHVAGIACGNGRASSGRYQGVAFESTIIAVKLGTSLNRSYPRTTQLMTAIDFVMNAAISQRMPIAINISFGNTYGSHDGNSLLEQYINNIANLWQTSIIVGTGNEGASRGHASGILKQPGRGVAEAQIIELSVGSGETSLNVQIWKNYFDDFSIDVIAPDGSSTGPLRKQPGKQDFRFGSTQLALFYGEPKPINKMQELFFVMIPEGATITSGIWKFVLTPKRIVTGNYNFWLPTSGILSPATGFLRPAVETTLTIPSTAVRVISVGAYNSDTSTYADFSGRGYNRGETAIKPDLAAPGVNIVSAAPGGGYDTRTGTSMATPFVTGAAALLMEWGIIKGNDIYLYGEKLKAYLINGAKPLPGFSQFPNPQVGYGALCVRNSLPV